MDKTPPLDGVRVLDLSTGIAGAYATKLLADAGAEVLKLELPGGDPLRRWSASHAAIAPGEDGALFRFLHTSKRAAIVDFTTSAGRDHALALAADADLVVDTMTPATLAALGIEPAAVCDTNRARGRATSWVSLSPFGRGGPWSERPATEFTLQAWCGSTASRGTMDRPPIAAGGRLGEWVGGAYAAVAALTAHHAAARTGIGVHVDVSLFEVMALTMAPNSTVWESLAGGPLPFGRTLEVPSIFAARDGWIGFCTITGQQWKDFCVLIERADLVDDPLLARWDERVRRVAEVDAMIHGFTRRHSVDEIIERAVALRIPVAALGTGETITHFDHFVARGAFVKHPGADFLQPRPPYRLSETALRPLAPSPRLGADEAAWTARGDRTRDAGLGTAAPSALRPDASRPLAGLRIVDFTAFWAGPFVTHYLAALGADVIKIESIQRPDGMRFQSVKLPPTDQWWEWSALYHGMNLNKRGITLDLTRPEGVALVKRLCVLADATVENFSPRVMDGLGLGWEVLSVVNPRLVVVRMPAFGLDGPWRDRVGFAQTMEQVSGMAWLTGFADAGPVIPRGTCDPLAGLHAIAALLVALEHRRRTGRGQLVEATMVEAALNAASELVLEHGAYGASLMRDGNRGPVGAPQNLYPCRGKDAWLALSITNDNEWGSLVETLGRPAWAIEPSLAHATGRRARHDEIDRGIAAWTADQDVHAAADTLLARGVPAAPVQPAARQDTNPQLRARGFFEPIGHAIAGQHEYPGLAFRLHESAARRYQSPAPTLGEHNDEILRELLGLDDAEIAALRANGIIGERPAGL
jgi:crotonobetainyl-CoA:carnitine CoA-transferase CaiB-like acyl-CoA transferase